MVVHLAGTEPPADFERRLQGLVSGGGEGNAVAARMGGVLQAALAPLDGGEQLRATLAGLFPGADVQVMAAGRQVVVFARPGGAARK